VNSSVNQEATKQDLERTLESAVIVSWGDLMHGAQAGLIQIEYGFATAGTLDYLKVWSSVSRGHWLLACEYWMLPSTLHRTGVHFDSGYESKGLAHILESVMRNQLSFVLPENLGRQGLLQIPTPTAEECVAAGQLVRDALNHLGPTVAKPASA
jgi:hypothetical protein